MSHQHNESTPVINNIYGGQGGQGGQGGVGGHGGAGEGPTFNYNRVQNVTNNIGGSLVIHSDSIVKILGKWLEYPPETKDRQYHLQSLHHEDTGRWLLRDDRFIKWKATPGCLWIKGICESVLLSSSSISDNWSKLGPGKAY
ncbi:hypothetical protein C8J57DRAFT_156338 [Mycena rebaudengoi]|nr:hypothetical protein C8J57DRAFT_156338 [Mycena rebaudengoi]